MRNATECIQAVKTFEENVKDRVVIERIAEKITQKCYKRALEGYSAIIIGLYDLIGIVEENDFIEIVEESQGVSTSAGMRIIEKLVVKELEKYGFNIISLDYVGLYISWKENEKECE